jgi:Fe-S-cluster-containing hydrogenase component 2
MPNSEDLLAVDEKVLNHLPAEERRRKGPYAMIECFQNIPCNPCTKACHFGAILPMKDINELPQVDYDRCTGCGLCAAHCSGLAIFIINEAFSETQTEILMPFEYFPRPRKGDVVDGVNRDGKIVTKAVVQEIRQFPDKTTLLGVVVDDRFAQVVRGIRLPFMKGNLIRDGEPENVRMDESIVCRCEDIDMDTLTRLMNENHLSLNDLKLEARFTMGPCQGKTCTALLVQQLSRKLHIPPEQIKGPRYRQPLKPVPIGELAGYEPDTER